MVIALYRSASPYPKLTLILVSPYTSMALAFCFSQRSDSFEKKTKDSDNITILNFQRLCLMNTCRKLKEFLLQSP